MSPRQRARVATGGGELRQVGRRRVRRCVQAHPPLAAYARRYERSAHCSVGPDPPHRERRPRSWRCAVTIALEGVSETMLWTLHNRASEARRPDAFLVDPAAVRIYDAIPYDYAHKFGKPNSTHPLRSRIFDDALRPWLRAHPGG